MIKVNFPYLRINYAILAHLFRHKICQPSINRSNRCLLLARLQVRSHVYIHCECVCLGFLSDNHRMKFIVSNLIVRMKHYFQ